MSRHYEHYRQVAVDMYEREIELGFLDTAFAEYCYWMDIAEYH